MKGEKRIPSEKERETKKESLRKRRKIQNGSKKVQSAAVGAFQGVVTRGQRNKSPPISLNCLPLQLRLESIQNYISSFHYNYSGKSFFKRYMRKNRGMSHLIDVVKRIVARSLPIQCVEGVFLAVSLTNAIAKHQLLRFPITFKSLFKGEVHSHVVLAVRVSEGTCDGSSNTYKWGSLGISRISTLMYKEAKYESLLGLVKDFHDSYTNCRHELQHIVMGLPFPQQDNLSEKILPWNVVTLHVSQPGQNIQTHQPWENDVDTFATHCESAADYYYNKKDYPEWWPSLFSNCG
jgi:hypothetical protein